MIDGRRAGRPATGRTLTSPSVTIFLLAVLLSSAAVAPLFQAPALGSSRVEVGAPTPASIGTSLGVVSPSLQIAVSVGFFNSSEQDFLNQLVQQIYTPGSYEYHSYMSSQTYSDIFAPSPAVYGSAVSYFQSYGIATYTDRSRLLLNLVGTAGQFQQAFGTSIGFFSGQHFKFYANTQPLYLPSTLSPYVTSVVGLENYTFFIPTLATSPVPPISPPYQPAQLEGAYNESALLAKGINGSGNTIVLIDAGYGDKTIQADVAEFSLTYGLPVPLVNIQTVNSSDTVMDVQSDAVGGVVANVPITGALVGVPPGSGWDLETALDLEWSHSMAPGANLVNMLSFDPGPGLVEAIGTAIANHVGNIVSQSFGGYDGSSDGGANASGSAGIGMDSFVQYIHPFYAEAAVTGITVLASSGDWGNTCPGASSFDIGTCYPASDPLVTSVGGTSLTISNNAWASETAWTCDPGCTGGGYSSVFARPNWQTGPGLSLTNNLRGVPDVAADGDPNTGVVVVSEGINYGAATFSIGGTSLASPLWAGMISVMNQATGVTTSGFYSPTAYSILNSPDYPALFHDITSGNNCYSGHPCYNATAGWDATTGVGSPNVGCMVSKCVPPSLLPGVSITSPTQGQTVQSSTLTVTGTHTLPPGNFQTGSPNSATDYQGNQQNSLDVLQGWFSDYRTLATGQTAFNVNIRVQDLSNIVVPTTGALGEHWEIKWSYGGATNYAEMVMWYQSVVSESAGGTGLTGLFFYAGTITTGTAGTTVAQNTVNGTYTAAAPGLITITVPTSDVSNPTLGSTLLSATADTQEFIGTPALWLQFTVHQTFSPSTFSYRLGDPLNAGGYVQVALNNMFTGGVNATLVNFPSSHQWSATLNLAGLPSGLYTAYARQVVGGVPGVYASVPFTLVATSKATATLVVQAKDEGYAPGHQVQISGTLLTPSGQPLDGRQVGIEVDDPSGSPLFVDQVATTSTGQYQTSFQIPSNAQPGTYVLRAAVWGLAASTTFTVGTNLRGPSTGSSTGTIYTTPSSVAVTGIEILNGTEQQQTRFTNGEMVVANITMANSGSTPQNVLVSLEFLSQHGSPLFLGAEYVTVGAGQTVSVTVSLTLGVTFPYANGKYFVLGFAWDGLISQQGSSWNAFAPRSSSGFQVK